MPRDARGNGVLSTNIARKLAEIKKWRRLFAEIAL
jgi:hypothetical protein